MDAALLGKVQSFRITGHKLRITDDDFVDRMNHYYTTTLIILFSLIICAKQYLVGDPLQCWVPPQFSGAWEQYTENYCWVKNTYFVAPNETFPKPDERAEREIHYYQWVPFVLALQAFLFYVPIAVWRTLNWQSGIQIKNVVQTLNDSSNLNPESRRKNVKSLAEYIVQVLFRERNRDYSLWGKIKHSINMESYLTLVYLLVKILFIVNIVGQFLLLDVFLGPRYHLYGLNMLSDLWSGLTWKESGHFPRVTYCDFKVRDVGHIRPYTVQCVLVVNLFNEKIYIFLWFWLVMLLLITIFNLFSWVFWMLMPGKKNRDVKNYLMKEYGDSAKHLSLFTSDMKRDCLLVLRIAKFNCGEILSRELAAALYDQYCEKNGLAKKPEEPSTLPKGYLDGKNPYGDIPLKNSST